ncbi:hypothetical protein BC936DRAFT_148249 [Jimgerdemannia flammicorona]|uniref:Protein kinase domain-containing protein n=1 Tax=Jimgerdemannia flammicorona TaxID=994334 RepID=A0A433D3G6_9FUNG|nr:hypothetical protein BC936DRAFT_148249 [Jimgerdemannia flammicorona]
MLKSGMRLNADKSHIPFPSKSTTPSIFLPSPPLQRTKTTPMELSPPEPTSILLRDANALVKRIQSAANVTKSNRQTLGMLSHRVADTVHPLNAIAGAHALMKPAHAADVEVILYPPIIDLINVLTKILEVITKHGNKRHPLAFFNVFNYLHVRDQIVQANRSLDRIINVFLKVLEQTLTVADDDEKERETWEAAHQKWVTLKEISYKRRKEMVDLLKQEFDQAEIGEVDLKEPDPHLNPPHAPVSEPSTDWTGVTEINETQLETLIIKRRSIPLVQLMGPIEGLHGEKGAVDAVVPDTVMEETHDDTVQTITQELITSVDEATKVYNGGVDVDVDVAKKAPEDKSPNELELFISKIISEGTIEFIPYNQFADMSFIGEGGYGTIFSARWTTRSNAMVAIKRLDKAVRIDQYQDFVRELKIMTKVNNGDNVVHLHVYCPNGSLRQYYSQPHYSTLDWADRMNIACDIARGIYYCHNEGVLHGDLHSGNILIDAKGKALITDFGLSKLKDTKNQTTSVSILAGLLPYIAPEKLKNNKLPHNVTCDVYALGVLFWELGAARTPFKGFDYDISLGMAIFKGVREKDVRGTPQDYKTLYKLMWAGDPEQRPSMERVLEVLEMTLDTLHAPVSGDLSTLDTMEIRIALTNDEEDNEDDPMADSIRHDVHPNVLIPTDNEHHYSGNYGMSLSIYTSASPPSVDIWEACSSANAAAVEYLLTHPPRVKPDVVRGIHDDTLLMYTASRCAVPLEVLRVLLENGAEVNAKNKEGNTVLHLLCANCPLPLDPVRLLLEKGADVNERNNSGKSPIHLLGNQRQPLEALRVLIEVGNADVNAVTGTAGGVFHHFLRTDFADDPEIVKLLLESGADTSITDEDGDNALVFASSSCLIESAKYLLEHDLKSSSPFNIDFALRTCHLNKNKGLTEAKAMRKLLLCWKGHDGRKRREELAEKLGVTLNEKEYEFGNHHFERFTYHQLRDMVKGEMDLHGNKLNSFVGDDDGTDSDSEPATGRRPHVDIWTAAASGQADAVRYYLTNHLPADPNMTNEDRQDTLLQWTAQKSIMPEAVIKVLLAHGADPEKRNAENMTALHVVCQSCPLPYEAARLLLDHGANPNAEANYGKTALHFLGNSRHPLETMRLLLSRGANVNAMTTSAGGIFHHCLRTDSLDDPEVMALLLEFGGDTSIVDEDGDNALVFASSSCLLQSAHHLLSHDLKSSSPFNVAFALATVHLNRNKGPNEVEAMTKLLRGWQGEEGLCRRQALGQKLSVKLDSEEYRVPEKHWARFTYHQFREMGLGG